MTQETHSSSHEQDRAGSPVPAPRVQPGAALGALLEVGRVLVGGLDMPSAAHELLRIASGLGGWAGGNAWLATGSHLELLATWAADAALADRLHAAAGAIREGGADELLALVGPDGEPADVPIDGSRDGDWQAPGRLAGLPAATVLAVRGRNRSLGVAVFFGTEGVGGDEELALALQALGQQVGAYMERAATDGEQRIVATRLETLVTSRRMAVLIEDERHRIKLVNDLFCRMFQLESTPSAMVGQDCSGMAADSARLFEEPGRFTARIEDLLAAGEVNKGERIRMLGNRIVERDFLPVTSGGRAAGWIWVYRDVTERLATMEALETSNRELGIALQRAEELAEEAEQANAAKSAFLASMSHEIRTPMNGVLGMNEMLLASDLTSEQRAQAESVHAEAMNLLGIIDQILDLSKVEAGRLELEIVDFDLHGVITAAGSVVRPAAQRRNLPLRVRLERDVPVAVRGDPLRLRQVLVNLLGNAIKFTEQGAVMLRAESVAGVDNRLWVRFEVVDSGIGIAPAALERIFQPFSQADNSTTRRYGGTGLGLKISQEIVELMGGSIDVVSTLGEGSKFSFTLPFEAGDQDRVEHHLIADDGDTVNGLLGGRRILLVEDNPVNRELAEVSLRRFGAEVETAWDGVEALDRFKPGRYDAIVMDVRMPNMDGYDAAREIRRREEAVFAAATPILALTADAMVEDRDRALAAGMNEHLGKPFRTAELGELLAELIDGSLGAASPRTPARSKSPATGGRPVPAAPAAAAEGEPTAAETRPRILVVDDNETNRRVASVHLARHPVAVTLAASGLEALAMLSDEPVDLVLLDGMMPNLDGPAVAREIRRREAAHGLPPVPVIAVTASILPEDIRRMLEAGMDDHLAKPLRADEVTAILDRWLPTEGTRRSVVIPPAAASAVAETARADEPAYLDLELFARLADLGDPAFVERIVRLFLADAAERVAQVDEALDVGDMLHLREALHSLEGVCGNVGAMALDRAARELHGEIHRAEDRGEDPMANRFGPSGLEPILDITRMKLQERLAQMRR